MTLKTSKGNTYEINWMWGPVGAEAELMLEMSNINSPLSTLASEFEGVKKFERFSELEGDMVFEGYTELLAITRSYTRTGSKVQISLIKPYTR